MTVAKKLLAFRVNDKSIYVGMIDGVVTRNGLKSVYFRGNGIIGDMLSEMLIENQPAGVKWEDTEIGIRTDFMTLAQLDDFFKWIEKAIAECFSSVNTVVSWLGEHDFTIHEE